MNSTINITSNCGRMQDTHLATDKIPLIIGLSLLILLTFAGNFLVLLSFFLEPKLRTPFNYFIFNLAVTDFLIAITAMTFYSIDTTFGYWPFGPIMCGAWIYFDYAMTFASILTMLAISIDRFWAVTWVLHYQQKNTPKRTIFIIGIVWACVFVVWTPPFIKDRMKHNFLQHTCSFEPSENLEFTIAFAVIAHYLPTLLMIVSYIKVCLVMHRQYNGIRSKQTVCLTCTKSRYRVDPHEDAISTISVPSQTSPHTEIPSTIVENGQTNIAVQRPVSGHQRERRIFVTLTYVLVCYLICWFPFFVVWDVYAWHPSFVPGWLFTFLSWVSYINSTLNPLLYGYTNRDFRSTFKKIMLCQYRR